MDQNTMLLGLEIFKKYGDADKECNWGHDIFYADAPAPSKMKKEDVDKLLELDWMYDNDEDGWSHFN